MPQIRRIGRVASGPQKAGGTVLQPELRRLRYRVTPVAAALAASMVFPASSSASTYLFHLSCTDRVYVARWESGVIDPGKEYFRRVTETRHQNCLVASFDPSRDTNLPVESDNVASDAVRDLPVLGAVVCGVLGCSK